MLTTSSYAISGTNPDAIAISRGVPVSYRGLRYLRLAPTREMLRLSRSDFETAYSALLSTLDPHQVWAELHALTPNPILCCWEPANFYCHRRLVSTWLEAALDVSITEVGLEREACLPPSLAPEKPPSNRWTKKAPPSHSTQLTNARTPRPTRPSRAPERNPMEQKTRKPPEVIGEKTSRTRGTGSIYLRGRMQWLQFYRDGLCVQESSKSTDRKVAEKLLIKRLGEIANNTYVSPKIRKVRVSELAEAWLADCRIRGSRSLSDQNSRWKRRLQPFFGVKQACAVTTSMLTRYIESRQQAEAASATINRELSDLRRMFRFGLTSTPQTVRPEYIPTFNLLDESGNVRRGFIEEPSYRALVAAMPGPDFLWLRTLLEIGRSFGWRKAELLGLRVSQVDMLDRSIVLYSGTTKNKKPRKVIMTEAIFNLLGECIQGKQSQDFVFTRAPQTKAGAGKMDTRPTPVREFRNQWHRLCCRAGLGWMVHRACYDEAVKELGKDNLQLSDLAMVKRRCPRCEEKVKWSDRRYVGLLFHDLRRSAVREMVRGGTGEKKAMSVTGHKTTSTFRRYDITDERDLRDTAKQIENHQREKSEAFEKSLELFPGDQTTAIQRQSGPESSSDSEAPAKHQTATLQ